ncbi:MAG: Crp/Fnr family transcriptional regulator [Alphaproteobacteria bacterium]
MPMPKSHWLPEGFLESCPVRRIAANERLFHSGQRALAIFEVIEGQLRLVRHTVEGHQVTMHVGQAGELVAEAALFSDNYHCDAFATEKARVRVLEKTRVLAQFRNDPAVAERFLSVMAHQVQRLRQKLELRNIRSARQRLIHYLLLSAQSDGRTVRMTGTLKDLATELGLTHEALYRTLAKLEKEGLIERTPSALILQPGNTL